jgi:hypothetical protein
MALSSLLPQSRGKADLSTGTAKHYLRFNFLIDHCRKNFSQAPGYPKNNATTKRFHPEVQYFQPIVMTMTREARPRKE